MLLFLDLAATALGSVALLGRDGRSLKMGCLHAALAVWRQPCSCTTTLWGPVPRSVGLSAPNETTTNLLLCGCWLVAVVSGEHSRQLAGATESDVVFTDAPRIAAHCCCYYYSEGSRYIFLSLEREEEMSNQCRPRVRVEYPPNLSILISGGKETNRDSLSKGD